MEAMPVTTQMTPCTARCPELEVPARSSEGERKITGPLTGSPEVLPLHTKGCSTSLLSTTSRRSVWRTARRGVGRFLFDWLKTLGLYTVVVCMATFLFLVGAQIVGYVSYSHRPLPGWGGGVFSWSEVNLYVVWLPVLAYSSLYMGALLFPFARALGWLGSPRWVIGVFGSLLAGIAAFLAALAAGWWYVDLSQYPVYAGAVAGMIYGAVLLPRIAGPIGAGRNSWKHWAGIAATILVFGGFVSYPLLSK
jgi:hypothetical protein